MRIRLALAALASTVAMSAPASAAMITYTLTGLFSGTAQGGGFMNEPGIFTGIGDTNSAFIAADGVSRNVILSSLKVAAVNNPNVFTFTATSPTSLRFGTNGGYAGFIVDTDGNNPSVFYTTTLAGYDGVSAVSPTNVNYVESNGTFQTSLGPLTITNQSNLQFSAAVAAVPEPATWAFMIVGFGGIGGVMRRRQRSVATAVRFA